MGQKKNHSFLMGGLTGHFFHAFLYNAATDHSLTLICRRRKNTLSANALPSMFFFPPSTWIQLMVLGGEKSLLQ